MKDFALDVWTDLRERRLWPVAVLLLLGLVAVPAVLVKPAQEAPADPAGAAAPTPTADSVATQALLKGTDGKPLVQISSLDQFTPKDPFKPIEQLKPIAGTDALKSVTGAGGGASSAPAGATPGAAQHGGGPPAGFPGGGPGETTPGGTTPGGGGQTTKPPSVKKYTYVVDLSFGQADDMRRYQSFDRLGMLPSQSSPLLVYLGVDGTGTHAAFLVDSTLDAAGEGSCRPSATNCGVVYMEPGEKETFNDGEGHSYELLIDQIRKVEVGAKSSHAKAGKAGKSDEPKAGTADQQPRRFLFPVLIDLETGVQP